MLNEFKILVNNIVNFRKKVLNEAVSSNSIVDAINDHKILYIYYNGDDTVQPGYRTIKPFVVGSHKKSGNTVIRAWQDTGNSDSYNNIKYHNYANKKRDGHEVHYDHKGRSRPGWRLFRLDKITSLMPTGETFRPENIINNGRGVNYNPNDKEINVIAAIQPTSDKTTKTTDITKDTAVAQDKKEKSVMDVQTPKFQRFFKAAAKDRDIDTEEIRNLWNINQKIRKKSPTKMMVVQTEKGDMVLKDESQRGNIPADAIVGNLKDLYNSHLKKDVRPDDVFFTQSDDKKV